MLSQIGCIILPNETLEKLYRGGIPNEKERAMVARVPAVTKQLLSGIPRLEAVWLSSGIRTSPIGSIRPNSTPSTSAGRS